MKLIGVMLILIGISSADNNSVLDIGLLLLGGCLLIWLDNHLTNKKRNKKRYNARLKLCCR